MRRWEEIRIRQHRLLAEAEHQAPAAHFDHIMRSGFTMSDIKGLQRNYSEDAVESEEAVRNGPQRPTRVVRRPETLSPPGIEINGEMHLSDGENAYSDTEMEGDDRKKRGRSPFRLFGKKRDHSKDKLKDRRTPEPEPRRGAMQQRTVARSPTMRASNADLRGQQQMAVDRKNMGSPVESFGNEIYDAECLKLINEYFYGVRIFPGQDPTHVYVGWVTTQYHVHSKDFSQDKVRHASIFVEDDGGKTSEV